MGKVGALNGSDGAKYHCEKTERYRLVGVGFNEAAKVSFLKTYNPCFSSAAPIILPVAIS